MLKMKYRKLTWGYLLKDLLYISLCSVLIAFVFMLITMKTITLINFWHYFLISQSIGLCISWPANILFNFFKPQTGIHRLLLLTACVVLGSIAGSAIAMALVRDSFPSMSGRVPFEMVVVGIILGFILAFFFMIYDQYNDYRLSVKDEKLKRLSLEKEKLNTDLKLLQAQVEPHFLFNTLSNILSLLDTDVPKGKKMLENLTRFLRTALVQSRRPENRLRDEIVLIRTYLDIFKIRMGERLTYKIDIPAELYETRVPPMILQPLVENAIKHGIEPKIEGGKIAVSAALNGKTLRLSVSDTGLGIQEKSGAGVGTGNIKKRLNALYGDKSSLSFEEMEPEGLTAIVEIPHGTNH